MDDRTLLERAARAAGMEGCVVDYDDRTVFLEDGKPASVEWNPLTDDGDALRLAVKLGLQVTCSDFGPEGFSYVGSWNRAITHERHDDDPCAATRRAIVRAAALEEPQQ